MSTYRFTIDWTCVMVVKETALGCELYLQGGCVLPLMMNFAEAEKRMIDAKKYLLEYQHGDKP